MSTITRLILREFRCFEELRYEPEPGLNFITGPNAQGKTSILEAACVLLRLRSPLTANTAEMLRFGNAAFSLEGTVGGTRLSLTCNPPTRSLKLDGASQSSSTEYLSRGRIVWFGTGDLSLVNGASEQRRKLLDSAGLQIGGTYRGDLKDYERALKSRNLLLRDGRPRREIESYDIPLTGAGERILAARQSLVSELAPLAADACCAISGEMLDVTYRPGSLTPMVQALQESRPEEIRLRQTRVGPHRDDLFIQLNGFDAAAYASQGQCRTVALALKLALATLLERKHGTPPLLLLDDIFGELDPDRRDSLLRGMPPGAQALLSTASLEKIVLPPDSKVHRLKGGLLHPLS